jgi:hypothetical protein
LNVITDLDPVYLNAGLMKPRRGFTLVAGKEKLGVGINYSLTAPSEHLYDRVQKSRNIH